MNTSHPVMDAKTYWQTIQSPATRLQDPAALLAGAEQALLDFDNKLVRASALCVIVYRYLGHPELRSRIDLTRVLALGDRVSKRLAVPRDLHEMRWLLSLNMARANLLVATGALDTARAVLKQNLAHRDRALSFGQPFTNVVKSACALLGIVQHEAVPGDDELVVQVLTAFSSLGPEISRHYHYENHWVYEELALVYTLIFAIATCRFSGQKEGLLDQGAGAVAAVRHFTPQAIPASFARALGELRSARRE